MASILSLFDQNLTFERRVEKVITFSNRDEEILRNEARDYVLTDNLTHEYERLLDYFDDAQSGNGAPECCTWLSGFYGSGKSSFAKYFGLSFDPTSKVEDKAFHELFTLRFESNTLRQRIKALTQKYDTAVFLLDLAAQGVSDANNTPISTLLFDQVCAWAGYASDRKIADLTARLELDGKLEEFKEKAEAFSGLPYSDLISQPTLLIPVSSQLAHEYYPKIWTTPDAFLNAQDVSTVNDQARVQQMLELIEKKTGTRRVLFIIDEVGHFLRNNENLINNLDGLAKNLKEIGQGRAWMIATAQQTIPKTGPLFGLQDRFPIKIDLKASDIREITHKRLLRKNPEGASALDALFQEHGQKLVHSTKLTGCDGYPGLDQKSFVDFYPLLPQQFELLIGAISSLAKTHGGVGLRSAIRCVEEILINPGNNAERLIDGETGALITSADIYTILHKDLVSVAREITLQIDAIGGSYGEDSIEQQVAKTIAVLQQIEGFPSTRENIAALLHNRIEGQPLLDAVNGAVNTLLQNAQVPIGETDGQISFLSELVSQVEKERSTIPVTSTYRAAVQSKILKELFGRTPKTSLNGTKTVDAGVALFDGSREQELTGGDKEIRFLVRMVEESAYEESKTQLTQESLGSQNQSKVYICAPLPNGIHSQLSEVHRSEEICRIHRNDADQEVIRYLEGQKQLAARTCIEIQQAIRNNLQQGWFIFRGQSIAVDTLGSELDAAMKSKLTEVAGQVFSEFSKAGENVKANVAEAFLKTSDLSQITSERDPLGLVKVAGTDTKVKVEHPALAAVMALFDRNPNPDGKRMMEEFARAPYGWTKDTTRYLVAALFAAQKIKLKINGEELTVIGEKSLAAFKNNSSFNPVTLNANVEEIPPQVRHAAAKRLSELTGETVIPMPQRIADIATKYLPKFQNEVYSLPLKAQSLGVNTDRLTRLERSLNEALMGDGSEATPLFGAEESEIYQDLIWARELKASFKTGAEALLQDFASIDSQIESLKHQNLLKGLQEIWGEESQALKQQIREGAFVGDLPAVAEQVDKLKGIVGNECKAYVEEQKAQIKGQVESILQSPEYLALDEENQVIYKSAAEQAIPFIEPTLDSIQRAPQSMLTAFNELNKVQKQIHAASTPPPPPTPPTPPAPDAVIVGLPNVLKNTNELDQVLGTLEEHRGDLDSGKPITLKFNS